MFNFTFLLICLRWSCLEVLLYSLSFLKMCCILLKKTISEFYISEYTSKLWKSATFSTIWQFSLWVKAIQFKLVISCLLFFPFLNTLVFLFFKSAMIVFFFLRITELELLELLSLPLFIFCSISLYPSQDDPVYFWSNLLFFCLCWLPIRLDTLLLIDANELIELLPNYDFSLTLIPSLDSNWDASVFDFLKYLSSAQCTLLVKVGTKSYLNFASLCTDCVPNAYLYGVYSISKLRPS